MLRFCVFQISAVPCQKLVDFGHGSRQNIGKMPFLATVVSKIREKQTRLLPKVLLVNRSVYRIIYLQRICDDLGEAHYVASSV